MKKVYICSPCRGDYENNIQRAKEFSRAAADKGCIPITPHIYLTQFMDDNNPAERELALKMGRELVLMCDELWAFGLDCPTAGMAAEIELARERGIPVLNGFKAISEIPETEKQDKDPQDAGSVIIRVPAFRAMARCNEHLNHGPISIEVDGRVIIDLAKRLKETRAAGSRSAGDRHGQPEEERRGLQRPDAIRGREAHPGADPRQAGPARRQLLRGDDLRLL